VKKFLSVVTFAVLLLTVATTAAAQDAKQHKGLSTKVVTIYGAISDDAKTFITGKHHSWIVTNPDALTGHEGHQVTVKCRLSPDKTGILVLSVAEYVARIGDSAFRR
jgi:hypothetical protein